MSSSNHLHHDDAPAALELLDAICRSRPTGWTPTDFGAFVDWDELATSHLSTTERAAVLIARGVATLEQHGGGAGPLQGPLRQAIEAVASADVRT